MKGKLPNEKAFFTDPWKIFLISLVAGTVTSYFSCPLGRYSVYNFVVMASSSVLTWFSLWWGNTRLSMYMDERYSWIHMPSKRLIMGIAASLVFSVTDVLLIILLSKSIFKIDNRLATFASGGYLLDLAIALVLTTIISSIMTSRAFLIYWKQSIIEAEAFKQRSAVAQYEALRSQVNPHFLFNSLNTLTNLVFDDQQKAAKFIKQLSEVYRYVLDTRHRELVEVSEELRFVKSYLFLQQIRFGDNLVVELQLEKAEGQVAPMVIQMLLENAIKHNVVSSKKPLHIRLYTEEDYIIVENILQEKTGSGEPASGMGLENIRQRYSFLSARETSFEKNGSHFTARIPILQVERA
jgi:hypothetical protein